MSRRALPGSYIDTGPPDWVMMGCPGPLEPSQGGGEGVWLYASKDLTQAELSSVAERDTWVPPGELFEDWLGPPRITITLTATMKTFVLIVAADYPAAFKALFEQWTPGRTERPAVESRHQIEGGGR